MLHALGVHSLPSSTEMSRLFRRTARISWRLEHNSCQNKNAEETSANPAHVPPKIEKVGGMVPLQGVPDRGPMILGPGSLTVYQYRSSLLKNVLVGRQERLERCSRVRLISWPVATGGRRAVA